jgi:peptidoglycan glycosyltransferase
MDRSIRRLGAFLALLFCALFAQLNYIQVFDAGSLNTKTIKDDPSTPVDESTLGNRRPIELSYSRARGTISTADGVLLARSVPSGDRFQYLRQYPQKDLYAGVTGFFSYQYGASGLERSYNEELTGKTARQQARSIGDLFSEKDRTGNLTLSIRSDVQELARQALGDQLGSVVVMNPQTGAVLALWSNPSYDPNLLAGHDLDEVKGAYRLLQEAPDNPMLPKAYAEIYPPGSTFKVVTGSTGVETGKVTPTTPEYPRLTSLDLPQTTRNLPNFGGEACGGTLFTVLAKSCNTSFAQMGLDLGPEAMVKGAEAFGFNDAPPFELPTARSVFPTDFERNLPALAQSAIGQNSVAATPLQMCLVAAAIANDGVMVRPYVVQEVRDGEGDLVERAETTQWKRPVSPQTADTMRQAMRQVVAGGTATRLQIPGLDVGAKTGTAQFGPSSPLRSHAWVIAWAGPPGQKPTLAVAVIVRNQTGASETTGGRLAAPIAKQLIEQAMKPMPSPPAPGTTSSTTVPAGN